MGAIWNLLMLLPRLVISLAEDSLEDDPKLTRRQNEIARGIVVAVMVITFLLVLLLV